MNDPLSLRIKRLFLRSSKHPFPGNWEAIKCAVVCAAHAFSTEIKCRHCMFKQICMYFAEEIKVHSLLVIYGFAYLLFTNYIILLYIQIPYSNCFQGHKKGYIE